MAVAVSAPVPNMKTMDIRLPDEVPVMTLPNCVFFPQALMPLHIYEPRYRRMLKDVLATDRIFVVAGLDLKLAGTPEQFEPPHHVATLGIIRACQENANGTANLLLQGLARVGIEQILREEPYRRIAVRPLLSAPGAKAADLRILQSDLMRLITLKQKLGVEVAEEMADFLRGVDDPDTCVDLAAFSMCEDAKLKQRLLETLDTFRRFQLFNAKLKVEIEEIKLQKKLQGHLSDDDIAQN